MKPGYKILIAIGIGVGIYKLVSYNSAKKERLTNEVNRLVTDIRREDYFAIQNLLDPSLAQKISIEEIKAFTKDFNLTRESKFVLEDYDRQKDIIKVEGFVLDRDKKIPLNLTYKDNNGTLIILEQKFGTKKLEHKEGSFPLNIN